LNPFVDYLNSLRTQDAEFNPNYVEENRAESLQRLRKAHPWFPADEALRVKTRISALIEAMRSADFPADLVFMTGDAGDGKTAACVDLARAEGMTRPLEMIDTIGTWTIIKDASEVAEDQLLEEISRCRRGRRRLLVAINEGRLRRLHRAADLEELWRDVIEPSLASGSDPAKARQLDELMRKQRVIIVNFRHRMHVRAVTPKLLEIWSQKALWEEGPVCSGCAARARCPIIANIQSVRDVAVSGRIADTLTLAHYSGQRLPFRRLQAVLAFALTGGLSCNEVISGRSPLLTDRFFSLFFQRESRHGIRPEPISRALAPADPAPTAEPWREQRVEEVLRNDATLDLFDRAALQVQGAREAPESIRALRRRDVFLGADGASHTRDNINERPTWRRALELLEAAVAGKDDPLLSAVVSGLNRLHRHSTTLSGMITEHQTEPASFRDPQRASLEFALGSRFQVELAKGPVLPELVGGWLESFPSDMELRAWPEKQQRPEHPARLRLDARLVMMLLDVQEGFSFIPALGSHRRELSRFHAQMVALVPPQDIRVILRSGGNAWRLSAAGDKLQFEGHG
jgi:hypothetical protein